MRHRRATLLDFLTELLRFANNEMERQHRHVGGRCFPVCEASPFNPTVCRNCGLSLAPALDLPR